MDVGLGGAGLRQALGRLDGVPPTQKGDTRFTYQLENTVGEFLVFPLSSSSPESILNPHTPNCFGK